MIKENFIRLFEDSFRNNWDLPAYTDYGEDNTITYGGLATRIAHLHILFEQCGIKPNDKISLCGKNSINWATTYLATVTYGAIVVPILQDFHANDILHIVNHSESKLLFISDYLWEAIPEEQLYYTIGVFSLNNFLPLSLIEQNGDRELPEAERHLQEMRPDELVNIEGHCITRENIDRLFAERYPYGFNRDDVRYANKPNTEIVSINYTSGTTGFSKGVLTSGNALAGNITYGIQSKLLERGDTCVSFLPLAHAYGCAFEFLVSTCVGAHSYFIGRTPSAKLLLKAFAEVKPNCIFTVPLIIEKIYKQQILPLISKPSMRWVLRIPFLDQALLANIRNKLVQAFGGEFKEVIIGGAALNAEVEAFFHKLKFPYVVGYGMTECAPLICKSPYEEYVPLSVGKPLPMMEVKIVPVEGLTEGVGEIYVRGENLMSGYYKNPEVTRETIDSDGWMHTGDLGYIDQSGNLFIRGRNKTMLLGPSGQNIYPEEIEAKLNNMPYVMESIVIQQQGKLVALVCPDYANTDADQLNREELEARMEDNRKELNNMLAAYEKIAKIILYPHEFEKTPKKSIKRYLYTTQVI